MTFGFSCEVQGSYFRGEEVSSDVSVVSSDISFPMSACLPNYNLCTPERSFIGGEGNQDQPGFGERTKWRWVQGQ